MSKSSTSVGTSESVVSAWSRRTNGGIPGVGRPGHREPAARGDVGVGEPVVEQGPEARVPERRVEVADHDGRVVAGAAEFARTGRGRASRSRSRWSACARARPAREPGRRPTSPSRRACGPSCRRGRRRPPATSTRPRCRWRPARSARSGTGSRPPSSLARRTRSVPGRVLDEHDDVDVEAAEVVGDRVDAGLVVRVEQVDRGDPQARGRRRRRPGARAGRRWAAPARGRRCRPPTP